MKKRLAGVLLFMFITLGFSDTAFCDTLETDSRKKTAASDPGVESVQTGEWTLEGEEWRYKLSEHEYLEREWIFEDGQWYYLDGDGYLTIGSKRIDGKYYYFRENGEMATGWAHDDEESQWYYMNEDGTRKTGWFQAGGAWYWFDSKGIMYSNGFRMISGHKYYFFENGQMAANTFVEFNYYGADGLRDRQYEITLQGKRRPSAEEREAVTKAMEGIPGQWIEKCLSSGWEFMFYTDKDFFSAPSTEQGIYYIYHKTDTNYKKIKFTNPQALTMAIGEYMAFATGNHKNGDGFMADLSQYTTASNLLEPLPSYFDDKPEVWFGRLLEAYCDTEIFYDIRKQMPGLAKFFTDTLELEPGGLRPALEELRDSLYRESNGEINAEGPSTDSDFKQKEGPSTD